MIKIKKCAVSFTNKHRVILLMLNIYYIRKQLFLVLLFICLFFIFSCSNKNNNSADENITADTAVFFPVHDYFISQLKDADSAATSFILRKNINRNKDSLSVNIDSVKKLAAIFLETDLDKKDIKKFYKETIFEDLTTASYTFSYKTNNEKMTIKNTDVLLDRETQQVKWIFITRYRQNGDSSISEKLNWHGNKSFSINRIITLPGKPEYTEQVSVLWK